jgi:hypothetical protein
VSDSGTISDGPRQYSNNVECTWNLGCSSGSPTLAFDSFDTESGYDFVDIFDSKNQRIAHLSGSSMPSTQHVASESRTMKVTFTSDGSSNADGFSASFSCDRGGGGGPLLMNPCVAPSSSPPPPVDCSSCDVPVCYACHEYGMDGTMSSMDPNYGRPMIHDISDFRCPRAEGCTYCGEPAVWSPIFGFECRASVEMSSSDYGCPVGEAVRCEAARLACHDACGPPPPPPGSLESRVAAVNAECCDEASEDCSTVCGQPLLRVIIIAA